MVLILLKLIGKVKITRTTVIDRSRLISFISDNDIHFLWLDNIFFYNIIGSMIVIDGAGRFRSLLVIIEADLSALLPLYFLVAAALIYLADLRWLS